MIGEQWARQPESYAHRKQDEMWHDLRVPWKKQEMQGLIIHIQASSRASSRIIIYCRRQENATVGGVGATMCDTRISDVRTWAL
jgi:hypothetical protein